MGKKYLVLLLTFGLQTYALSQEKLSQFNIVKNRFPLELNQSFVPYKVNSSLWSGEVKKTALGKSTFYFKN